MKATKIAILICDGLVALLGFAFALIYIFRPEFMHYHSIAVNEAWADVDPQFQILILALMKVSGGGWLGVSIAITVLLYRFYRFEKRWFIVAIFLIGQSILIPTLYATLLVKHHSNANPPWIAALGAIILLTAGLILALARNDSPEEM